MLVALDSYSYQAFVVHRSSWFRDGGDMIAVQHVIIIGSHEFADYSMNLTATVIVTKEVCTYIPVSIPIGYICLASPPTGHELIHLRVTEERCNGQCSTKVMRQA